jgi:hypothetical protein
MSLIANADERKSFGKIKNAHPKVSTFRNREWSDGMRNPSKPLLPEMLCAGTNLVKKNF